mgnify:CR=1 FL=1|jgi:hypothetical protein
MLYHKALLGTQLYKQLRFERNALVDHGAFP